MIKKQKITGLLVLIAGVTIILIAIMLDAKTFQIGRLSVLGTALLAFGLARVIKMIRLEKNPGKAADYEAAYTDERTASIAGRAGKLALFITAYAEIAAGLIAALAFNNEIICQVLCYSACFICLLYFTLSFLSTF